MAILTSLRPFQRLHNGMQIELRLNEWPADVPLPDGSTIVGIGENRETPVSPNWRFILEPDSTIEIVGGWFRAPLSFEEVVAWYKTELLNLGWAQQIERGFIQSHWAALYLCHLEMNARLRLNIRRDDTSDETTIMIERVIKHPWPLPDEPTTEAQAFSRSDDEGMSP